MMKQVLSDSFGGHVGRATFGFVGCVSLVCVFLFVACSGESKPLDLCEPEFEQKPKDCVFGEHGLNRYRSATDFYELCQTPCKTAGHLRIINVDGLQSLRPLTGFETIDAVHLSELPQLRSLAGLETVETLKVLGIRGEVGLKSLEGLRDVTSVWNLEIEAAGQLKSFRGLETVREIGTVKITGNPSLTSVSALSDVKRREGQRMFVWISGNPKLRRIDALGKVREVETLTISGNKRLESLEGLMGLEKVKSKLVIRDNPELGRCEIEAFLDGLETGEYVTIENNHPADCEG